MKNFHLNWDSKLIKEAKEILNSLASFNISPSKENVLNFFYQDPKKIKVAIIGQDPYPQLNVANGYAFAVNLNQKIPKSLNNIFKEIKAIQGYIKTKRDLKYWVKQGVFLFNRSLTTIINQSNVHQNYWDNFTKKIITFLSILNPKIYWVLWGKNAQKALPFIKFSQKIIIDFHPSPFSFHLRKNETFKILKNNIDIEW